MPYQCFSTFVLALLLYTHISICLAAVLSTDAKGQTATVSTSGTGQHAVEPHLYHNGKDLTVDDIARAAAAASSATAKVAEALAGQTLPPGVKEAALEAASAAAVKVALGDTGDKPPVRIASEMPAAAAGTSPTSNPSTMMRREVEPNTNGQSSEKPALSNQTQSKTVEKLLYVGIFSDPRDFERRESARKGWMAALQRELPGSAEVLPQFVIGRRPVKAYANVQNGQASLLELTPPVVDASDVTLDVELGKELAEKGDLLHIPYEELSIRVLMFFAHAAATQYRFIVKVDVDSEFLFRPVLQGLRLESPDSFLYAGERLLSNGRGGKSPIDAEMQDDEIPEISAKRYFSGSCYLTSHSLAQRIAKDHLDHSLMIWSYNSDPQALNGSRVDDMDMGQWVAWEEERLLEAANASGSGSGSGSTSAEHVKYNTMCLCGNRVPALTQVAASE